jgi:CubicO group peptidase (beta-lactamase class C family)
MDRVMPEHRPTGPGAGGDIEPSAAVTAANWQFPPHNRWGFRNVRRILPTVPVRHDAARVRPLPESPLDLGAVTSTPDGGASLAEVLESTYADGFIVLHRGHIVYERYLSGLTPSATHIIMSVSKSVVGSLIGILAEQGAVRLDRTAGQYVPELRPDGYGAATVAALLDMRSRVRYSEDYADPTAEFYTFDAACGLRPPAGPGATAGMHAYLAALPIDPADTGDFRYRSTDTDVLGWIAERATGRGLAALLAEFLWQPMGAEADADLLVDPFGAPLADGGLCVTLRDLARFGQLQLDDGCVGGRTVIPAAWVEATRDGDRTSFARSDSGDLFPNGAYSRQWWAVDPDAGLQLALGIHGQMIYIDRPNALVCAQLASQPAALDAGALGVTLAACRAVARALR